jgi:hypothetical protein
MRALKILAEIVGLAVAGFALAAVVLAWRLSSGPLEIDFLTPYVEQGISDANASVEIGALALRWEGFDRPAVLAASDVRVRQKDGTLIAVVPESSADVSMPKLLRGIVAPLRIDLIRPHLRVTRTEAGDFSFGLGESETAEDAPSTPATGAPTRDVVKDLLTALDTSLGNQDSPITSLTRLTLVDGSVRIDDRMLGRSWVAPKASADLRRTATGRFQHRSRRTEDLPVRSGRRGRRHHRGGAGRGHHGPAGRPAGQPVATGCAQRAARLDRRQPA